MKTTTVAYRTALLCKLKERRRERESGGTGTREKGGRRRERW